MVPGKRIEIAPERAFGVLSNRPLNSLIAYLSAREGGFVLMNRQKQAHVHSFPASDSGSMFRAQVIGAMPENPVVIPRRFADSHGRQRAIRTPHWLSGLVASPILPDVAAAVDCADKMVAPRLDRTP